MIDGHLHIDLMSYGDIDEMLRRGIEGAVSCAYVQGASASSTLLDHFRLLLEGYLPVARARGFRLYLALGIHPRGIPSDWVRVLDSLAEWLASPGVVALGEVGLETGDAREREVLAAQLKIAVEVRKPAVVHLPGKEREARCREVLALAARAGLLESSLLVDHAGADVLGMILSCGTRAGLTVKPGRLTEKDVLGILLSHPGSATGILNSDAGNLKACDPLAVAATTRYLRGKGVEERTVAALAGGNARAFFGLT